MKALKSIAGTIVFDISIPDKPSFPLNEPMNQSLSLVFSPFGTFTLIELFPFGLMSILPSECGRLELPYHQ